MSLLPRQHRQLDLRSAQGVILPQPVQWQDIILRIYHMYMLQLCYRMMQMHLSHVGHGECYVGFCQCFEGWFGHDCAFRTVNVSWSSGIEKERPWLEELVHTPASWDPEPGAVRKRPLIYVYELPAMYNSIMLQYRNDQHLCHHRCFEVTPTSNVSIWYHGTYNIETGLHEYLLQSPHRTLDPEVLSDMVYQATSIKLTTANLAYCRKQTFTIFQRIALVK